MTIPIRLAWFLASLLVAAALVALWQVIADAGLVSKVFLPSPARTFAALVAGLSSSTLASATLSTIIRMIEGWLIASVVGISIGALIGTSDRARAYLAPMLEMLRPLPASALIPVFIAIFGLSESMILGVVAFGALWPMLLATIHGVTSVEPTLYEVARALRIRRMSVVFKISLPNAVPDILAGLRVGLTIALILAVVGEMLTSRSGLGSWLLQAARSFRAPDLFAGVVILGAIGFAGAAGLNLLEARLLRRGQTGI